MKASFKKNRYPKFTKKNFVFFIKEIDAHYSGFNIPGLYIFRFLSLLFAGIRNLKIFSRHLWSTSKRVIHETLAKFFINKNQKKHIVANSLNFNKSLDNVNFASKDPYHIILMNMTSLGNSPLFKDKTNNSYVTRENFYLKKFILCNEILFYISLISNLFLPTIKINEAFTVRSSASKNYFHWMIEDLPRILLFYSDKKNWHIPLLINKDVHENITLSLSRLYPHVTIYSVSSYRNVHAQKFHTSQYISNIPFDLKERTLAGYKEVDAYIKISRKSLLPIINYYIPKEPYDKNVRNLKLFIVPSSPNRLIYNVEPVIKAAKSMNYKILVLEEHSIFKQAKFFHQATSIVSFSGATLTNLIFCKSNCHVHILFGDNPLHSKTLWTKLASSSSKCKVKNWSVGLGQKSTHDGFIVDILLLKKVLSLSD